MQQYTKLTHSINKGGLLVREPSGDVRPASRKEILTVARQLVKATELRRKNLSAPNLVKDFIQLRFNPSLEHEVCGLILLDTRNRLIEYLEPFRGTIDQSAVYPREIVKLVLQYNAASIMLVHNHPSGNPEASQADVRLTQHLKQALALIDVRMLDHFIVAGPNVVSMTEAGLL